MHCFKPANNQPDDAGSLLWCAITTMKAMDQTWVSKLPHPLWAQPNTRPFTTLYSLIFLWLSLRLIDQLYK